MSQQRIVNCHRPHLLGGNNVDTWIELHDFLHILIPATRAENRQLDGRIEIFQSHRQMITVSPMDENRRSNGLLLQILRQRRLCGNVFVIFILQGEVGKDLYWLTLQRSYCDPRIICVDIPLLFVSEEAHKAVERGLAILVTIKKNK